MKCWVFRDDVPLFPRKWNKHGSAGSGKGKAGCIYQNGRTWDVTKARDRDPWTRQRLLTRVRKREQKSPCRSHFISGDPLSLNPRNKLTSLKRFLRLPQYKVQCFEVDKVLIRQRDSHFLKTSKCPILCGILNTALTKHCFS